MFKSIDEAIAQEREMAEKNRRAMNFESEDNIDDDIKVNFLNCATKHEQFAEWLEELKSIREMDLSIPQHFTKEQSDWIKAYCIQRNKEFYNKAIDDFVENISLEISESLIWGMIADCFKYKNMNDTSDKIVDYIINTANEIAKQLKAGDNNGT